MRLVIIGGSDAGISAGLRARELDQSAEVQLILADSFPNYSICGLPFYISGETPDWHDLAHRKYEELASAGLRLLMDHRAESIDPVKGQVRGVGPNHSEFAVEYDKLVIGTGAEPVRPRIEGLDLDGVHLLHTMKDSFSVRRRLDALAGGSVLIVGGGYIGLEMADASPIVGSRSRWWNSYPLRCRRSTSSWATESLGSYESMASMSSRCGHREDRAGCEYRRGAGWFWEGS